MEPGLRAVSWEAPEHHHIEKTGDWFFAFTVVSISIVISAILLGNLLFALTLAIGALVLALMSYRQPAIIDYEVSVRGVLVGDKFYPYPALKSYYIDEADHRGPQLLILTEAYLHPLLIIPLPVDDIDDIESIVRDKLPEEHLEESVFTRLLEIFGF